MINAIATAIATATAYANAAENGGLYHGDTLTFILSELALQGAPLFNGIAEYYRSEYDDSYDGYIAGPFADMMGIHTFARDAQTACAFA